MSYPQPPGYQPQGQWGPPPSGYGAPPPPHGYGPPPRKPLSTGTILLIVLLGLPALGFASCIACVGIGAHARQDDTSNERADDRGSTAPPGNFRPPPEEEPRPQPVQATRVTAKQLWQDYQSNEVRADDQYKGKTLLVTGTVQSIDKDFVGNIIVVLASPNQFMGVHATMKDSQKSQAAQLSKGDQVSVVCKGRGMIIGSPHLADCGFLSN